MSTAKKTVKLLAILGSPHTAKEGGNCDTLLEKAITGATEAANEAGAELQVTKIQLSKKKITPCTYCAHCHKTGGSCGINDDMAEIYEHILSADIVIHAFPIWFFSMPGFVKAYLDRWAAFYTAEWAIRPDIADRMRNKVMAAIAVCGDTDFEKMCNAGISIFKTTAEFAKYPWAGSVSACAEGPGDTAKNAVALSQSIELGRNSFAMASKY